VAKFEINIYRATILGRKTITVMEMKNVCGIKKNGELFGRCGRKGADGVPVRSNGTVSVMSIVWCDANGVFEEAFFLIV